MTTKESPDVIIITPKVAINAGIFRRDTIRPVSVPIIVPTKIQIILPSHSGRLRPVTHNPDITAEKVMTVPIERSIPPVMITNVTPSAKSPLTQVASSMEMILSTKRKLGDSIAKMIISTINVKKIISF